MIRREIQQKVDENRDFPPHELRSRFVPEIRRDSDVTFDFVEGDLVFHDTPQFGHLESSSSPVHKKKKMSNFDKREMMIVPTIGGTVDEKPSKIVDKKRKR
jgi:hypothetical protein